MDDSAGIGARIRALRERAGLQSRELAVILGIDASAMSNIERGKRGIKTVELAKVADALGVSPLAILDEDSLLGRLSVAPRVAEGTVVDRQTMSRLTALAELHEVLAQEGIVASSKIANAPAVDPGRWLSSADELAEWAATKLQVPEVAEDRFSDLIKRIEDRLGIDVLVEPAEDGDMAGASITDHEFPLIFVNSDQPTHRALFTLAHELGHVLQGDGDSVTLDVDLTAHDDRERFANAFAASLLMPEHIIRSRLAGEEVKFSDLASLVNRLGVSFESLVYRLHNLGIIDRDGRKQLQELGLRGLISSLKDKKLAAKLLSRRASTPEQGPPRLLLERAIEGYRRGVVSVRPVAGLLGLDAEDVTSVMESDAKEILVRATHTSGMDSDESRYAGEPA